MGRLLERMACLLVIAERQRAEIHDPQALRYVDAWIEGMEESYRLYLRLARTHYADHATVP